MNLLRRIILVIATLAGLSSALAQAPGPVPAVLDNERRTSYSLSGSTCSCTLNYSVYGDGVDYWNWIEVWLNGVRVNYNDATYGWTITSPSGSLSNLARPITNAVLTFNNSQTGTVQIVGARRPRRVSQFSEGAGVSARDLNQALSDIVTQNRETWDKINDVTGRGLISQPGVTLGTLPVPSACSGKYLSFDVTGLIPQCSGGGPGSGNVIGPASSTIGHIATWANTSGTLLADSPFPFAYAKSLGIKQDGVALTAPVSITSGQNVLTVPGGSFTASDVGKAIIVPGAGASSGYLVTTISAYSDPQHVNLTANAGTTLSASSKTISYGTDDSTNIASAITAALNGGFSIVFTDGLIFHSGTINWGFNRLNVFALGNNVKFQHVGSGIAHNFNGMTNYPGSQGAINARFGGPGKIKLWGNPATSGGVGLTTEGAHIDNWHFSTMDIAVHDAIKGVVCRDTGLVGSSAVETRFDIRVSNNADGAFAMVPTTGLDCAGPVASTFEHLIIEGTGLNTSSVAAILTAAINNHFNAGTIESTTGTGLTSDSASSRNTYNNVDIEANGTRDWDISEKYPVIINSAGAGTTGGNRFNTTNAMLLGGKFQSLTNNDNTLWSNGTEFAVACTNNGTNTTIINSIGGLCIAVEQAASILGNKTINTDNSVVLKIAGVDVTTAWSTYTPTLTATSGAYTTATATGRYKQIGKTIHLQIDITLTAINTATGAIIATLPVNSRASQFVGHAIEYNSTNVDGSAVILGGTDATKLQIRKYDGTSFLVNGNKIVVTMAYEIP
ncbi:hypothetical protein [Bradyrhizobium sp.]|jgi:hypothetical protein|uniref:hypothetical protein n=1 Tax=Bradyrhizobium sp. TaxID=376 RepID=UPI002DDD21C6|nr:hypothetical protein [Bradyrhizobium sp.]HEV2159568.1 hypothetical protein [Bradyrhizobium sp.]